MLRASLAGWDRKKLRLWLSLFFLALALPTGLLIHQTYRQLKWEAFHQHRLLAEELAARIDAHYVRLINQEEARSFADYAFLGVAGDPSAKFLQRSPLSVYPVSSALPGLIGHFQIDARGEFSTPLLPQPRTEAMSYGVGSKELEQRVTLAQNIQQILSQNRLVQDASKMIGDERTIVSTRERRDKQEELGAEQTSTGQAIAQLSSSADFPSAPAESQATAAQAAFDRLNAAPALLEQEKKQKAANTLGRVEDLKLDDTYQAKPADETQRGITSQNAPLLEKRAARKERSALPESQVPFLAEEQEADGDVHSEIRIRTFESEIDPFEFNLLDSGHFVLYRKVWRDGQRYIQGALIQPQPFVQSVVESAFRETGLSQMSDLIVAYQGDVLSVFSGQTSRYPSSTGDSSGALLYRTPLSTPLNALALIFTITRLPTGPGGTVVTWIVLILAAVLCGGFYLMYRLALGQIELARQQQDFVSAVSHELKTPLTSIRMYGEMLREGWASEDKKKTYYDFILGESERLSRLITNVLQLARMTRNELEVNSKPVLVAELMREIRSKISSQVERAGFELHMTSQGEADQAIIRVDADYVLQIIINLVDNAIKFSDKADHKVIDIDCRHQQDDTVMFTVRDYGPGVPSDQMKKIFKLFYRSENELTRETVGTGIGLALVNQLAQSMDGQVDVVNREPGAEFRVCFRASERPPPPGSGGSI